MGMWSWELRERFRRAVEYGREEEAKRIAQELWRRALTHDEKMETAEFIAETLRSRALGVRGGFETVEWDGIRVRTGYFPKLEVEERREEDEYEDEDC